MCKYLKDRPKLRRAVHLGIGTAATSLAVIFIFGMGAEWGVHKTANIHASEQDIEALIDQRAQNTAIDKEGVQKIVDQSLQEYGLVGKDFDKRVEEGILAFLKAHAADSSQSKPSNNKPTANSAPQSLQDHPVDPIDFDTEPVTGNPDARYQFIIYSDFECPFCKRFDSTVEILAKQYADDIAFTQRSFPLPSHGQAATDEVVAAQCVFEIGGNDAYWGFTHDMFSASGSNGIGVADGKLTELAEKYGVDSQDFDTCIEKIDAGALSRKLMAAADKANVHGTPTSYLLDTKTGKSISIVGAQPQSSVTSALDAIVGK